MPIVNVAILSEFCFLTLKNSFGSVEYMSAEQAIGLSPRPNHPESSYSYYHQLVRPAAVRIVGEIERIQVAHMFPTEGAQPEDGTSFYARLQPFFEPMHVPSLDILTPELVERWGEKQTLTVERGEPVAWELSSEGNQRLQVFKNGAGFYVAFRMPEVISPEAAIVTNHDALSAYSYAAYNGRY